MLLSRQTCRTVHPQNLTVATTGASGAIFLRHFLLAVEREERVETVNFIASDSALRVLAEELDIKGRSDLVRQIVGSSQDSFKEQNSNSIQRRHRSQRGQRLLSRRRHGRHSLQRGHSGPHRQWRCRRN